MVSKRVQRLVKMEGIEHWRAVRGRPVIWLAPTSASTWRRRLTSSFLVSIYSRQKNPRFDAMLRHGRTRFGTTTLLSSRTACARW